MNKEQQIKQTLDMLGVRATTMGYTYLIDAISAVMDDKRSIRGIIKKVYMPIAYKYDVRWASVERCIRYAIEESYTKAPLSMLERVFGNSVPANKDHPTNKHYIAAVANYVRMQLNVQNLKAVEARVMAV